MCSGSGGSISKMVQKSLAIKRREQHEATMASAQREVTASADPMKPRGAAVTGLQIRG